MAETEIEATVVVDARGLLCPMPIVKTAKAMKGLADGDVLKVISTDRGSDRRHPRMGRDHRQ